MARNISLSRSTVLFRGSFRQAKLSLVKKEAMVKMVGSGSAPMELKRRALKMVRAEDELHEAKRENLELKRTLLKLKTLQQMRDKKAENKHEAELLRLRGQVQDGQELWTRLGAMEQREGVLKAQLADAQHALREARAQVRQGAGALEMAKAAKGSLVAWKVQSSKRVEALERQVGKYQRWSQDSPAPFQLTHVPPRCLPASLNRRTDAGSSATVVLH